MHILKKTTIAAMVCGAIAAGAYAQTNHVVDGVPFADNEKTIATNDPLTG